MTQHVTKGIFKKPGPDTKSPVVLKIVGVERNFLAFSPPRLLENAFPKARKVFYNK